MKVEERVAFGHKAKDGSTTAHQRDFKREWRVRRAKKQLIERFGLTFVRQVIAYALVILLVFVAFIVFEATEYTHVIAEFHASVVSSIEAALVGITGLVAVVAAIVPPFKLAFASNKESSVSRGEVLFKEASMVKDQLGFLAKVKLELQELFDFLREFDDKIVLVPIIDDLDRCITDGRNVKVLEAMQLILSVPGAPILSFLAVDSRIVVASIEEHYEKVFAKTNISGHEYLDKIVQLPFAMPEPSPDKVKRLLSKSLEGDAATPVQVAQRLKVFGMRARQIINAIGSNQVTFKMDQTTSSPKIFVAPRAITPVVLIIEKFWGDDANQKLELDSKQALDLVCAAAGELSANLKELADDLILMDQTNVHKEEAIEVLCRATNTALEAGKLGFGEVSICLLFQAIAYNAAHIHCG